jgi:hypoxanthine phosphoribosyltransferase
MERMFGRPIVTQEQMRSRIRELGRQISADYAGKDLVLVGVLKGAYAFFADLARAIRIPVQIDFIIVTSYGTQAKTSGKVKLVTELTEKIKNRDVLLVEDIVCGTPCMCIKTTPASKRAMTDAMAGSCRSALTSLIIDAPQPRATSATRDLVVSIEIGTDTRWTSPFTTGIT